MRITTRFAALAACAAVAVAGTTPAAAATAPATTTSVPAAAAGWLAGQLTGGNHLVSTYDGKSYDGGGTADLIYALAAAKAGKSSIDAAIRYAEANVDEYTSLNDKSGNPGPYDGSVGKTAVAAFVAGADPTWFGRHNLLVSLKNDECTGKSGDPKDYTVPVCPAAGAARNIYSSISESLVILAESRGRSLDPKYAPSPKAIQYFLSLQCADGGFTSGTAGGSSCKSDVDATGYALQSLQALGGQLAAVRIRRAASYLLSTRGSSGAWRSQGADNVDSTGLAVAGLTAAHRPSASSRAWLRTQQVTTGTTVGKGASRGALKYLGGFDAASSIKATMDGILGLVRGTTLATLTDAGAAEGTRLLALDVPTVRHRHVAAGRTQSVTGTGFAAGEVVRALLSGKQVGRGTAGDNGTVTITFTVPAGASSGDHRLVLTGRRSQLRSAVGFVVTAASSAGGAPVLADTGRSGTATRVELLVGVGLLALGTTALLVARRPRGARR